MSTGRGGRKNCRIGKLHPRLFLSNSHIATAPGTRSAGLYMVKPLFLVSILLPFHAQHSGPKEKWTFSSFLFFFLFIIPFEVKGTSAGSSDKVVPSGILPTVYVAFSGYLHLPSLTPTHSQAHLDERINISMGSIFKPVKEAVRAMANS